MVALAKNFSVFHGRKNDDPDTHVQRFAVARPREIMSVELVVLKRDAFINTFSSKVTKWLSRYLDNHFNTYKGIVEAFLIRFMKIKTASKMCDLMKEMQQEDMDVDVFASKMLCLWQQVEEVSIPSIN